ncbi:MAG: DsrE family protein [Variibacter sp.]
MGVGTARAADGAKAHRVAIQVDQDDPAVVNLVLNNATNVMEHFKSKGEEVEVEVVAYGPGLNMLREDKSAVKDRIARLKDFSYPASVKFSACNNTKEGMEKKEGRSITIIPQAALVPSGVVRLMELQEQGWSYVRP